MCISLFCLTRLSFDRGKGHEIQDPGLRWSSSQDRSEGIKTHLKRDGIEVNEEAYLEDGLGVHDFETILVQ